MSFLQPQRPRKQFNVKDWNDQIAESRRRKEQQKRMEEEMERKEEERVRRELEELQQKYEREIQAERRSDQMQLPKLKGPGGVVGVVAAVPKPKKFGAQQPAGDFPFGGSWEHKTVTKKRVKRNPVEKLCENQEEFFHSRQQEKTPSPLHQRREQSPFEMRAHQNSSFGLPAQPPDFKREVEDMRQTFQKENTKLQEQLAELKSETDYLRSQMESSRAAANRELQMLQEDVEYFREEAERWKYTAEKYAKKVEVLQKAQRKRTQKTNAPIGELQYESAFVPMTIKTSFVSNLKELIDEAATSIESSQSIG